MGHYQSCIWSDCDCIRFHNYNITMFNAQLILAFLLAIAGLTLLFIGIFFAPTGEIHNSVLVAFGEVATFAGSLCGVDYHYRYRRR